MSTSYSNLLSNIMSGFDWLGSQKTSELNYFVVIVWEIVIWECNQNYKMRLGHASNYVVSLHKDKRVSPKVKESVNLMRRVAIRRNSRSPDFVNIFIKRKEKNIETRNDETRIPQTCSLKIILSGFVFINSRNEPVERKGRCVFFYQPRSCFCFSAKILAWQPRQKKNSQKQRHGKRMFTAVF